MDDFMVHVNGGAIGFQRQFHDIHRSHHARAESARADTQQNLGLRLCSHLLPMPLNSQNTIISKTLTGCMQSGTQALCSPILPPACTDSPIPRSFPVECHSKDFLVCQSSRIEGEANGSCST